MIGLKPSCLLLLLVVSIRLIAQPGYAPFLHGVASGDPLPDRVILWTHVSPSDSAQPVTGNWRIATDSLFDDIVNSGYFTTDSSRDFSVKVDASGLQPFTYYYYDFETGGNHSAVGRTKTAPAGAIANMRFAVASCAKYSKGYFNAYGRIAERDDIDAVIHLGDYIYESKDSGEVGRPMMPYVRCSTLVQFRTRYAQYHTDPDLVYARQRHPFINVWDDHETGNDCWQYGSPNFPDSIQFAAIKRDAAKAYFEWIPIREDSSHPGRVYRSFGFGDLIDLIMIDTRREGRMRQLAFADSNKAAINDTGRTILGREQFNWLIAKLDNSTARWRIIGQQVMMAPMLIFGNPVNEDQWDGYPAERAKLYEHLENQQMDNVVVLTGDLHVSLANDLPKDTALYDAATGEGSVAVEFITPAIASSRFEFSGIPHSLIEQNDPHIRYADLLSNGYMVLDVTPGKVQGDYYYVATTDSPDTREQLGASMYSLHGTKHFSRSPLSVQPRDSPPRELLIEIYPNPAGEHLVIEIRNLTGDIKFKVYDAQGRVVRDEVVELVNGEAARLNLRTAGLGKGVYFLRACSGTKEIYSAKFTVAD